MVTIATLGLSLLTIHAGAVHAPESTSARYEVAYHHVLHNRSREPLRDVRVYLTIPPSDGYQTIEEFRIERFGRDVHISNRRDEYGNQLKRVAIAEINPGEEVRIGFTCEVILRPPAQFDLTKESKATYDSVDRGFVEHYTRDHAIFGLQTPIIRETAARLLQDYPDPSSRAVAKGRCLSGPITVGR